MLSLLSLLSLLSECESYLLCWVSFLLPYFFSVAFFYFTFVKMAWHPVLLNDSLGRFDLFFIVHGGFILF